MSIGDMSIGDMSIGDMSIEDDSRGVTTSKSVETPQAPTPPKSKLKAPKPPAEPLPPAIQALREIVGIYPPKATWETLIAACKGKTKSELQAVHAEFLLRTPNKHNWTWITEGVHSYSGKPNGKATSPKSSRFVVVVGDENVYYRSENGVDVEERREARPM